MQKNLFLKEKLDSLFKNQPQKNFLLDQSLNYHTYSDLEAFIHRTREFILEQGLYLQTPILVWLPRGICEISYLSAFLYLGVPTMVLAETAKLSEVKKIFNKYPFQALVTTENLNQQAQIGPSKSICLLDNQQIVIIQNSHQLQVDVEFSWLLNTSGSTGESKAVMISSQNLFDRTIGEIQLFQIKNQSHILNILPFCHDLGLNQLLTTLYTGSLIEIFNKKLPAEFARRMQINNMDGLTGMPEVWNNFLEIAKSKNLQMDYSGYLTISGGSMSVEKLNQLRNVFNKAKIYKTYGQTETFRTLAQTDQAEIVDDNAGGFISGVSGALVTDEGKICEIGQVGELIHFGAGTMSGYWMNPVQTESKLAMPLIPSRSENGIRTGDYFKQLANQRLKYIGRNDDQVKINGSRFQLAEIENCILQIPTVDQVCVIKHTDSSAVHLHENIIGFIILKKESQVTDKQIKEHCILNLEKYKIPREIIVCDFFPHTTTFKIDRQALLEKYINSQQKENI